MACRLTATPTGSSPQSKGSQASNVKVKGATQASKIVLGDGKTVTVVASNGNTILIGSASSAYGDVSYADEIVSTMRLGNSSSY